MDVASQHRPLRCAVCLGPEYITAACGMVAEMVEALPSVLALGHRRNSSTPAFLTSVLRNIIVSLARLPLVNSYTRVPPLVSLSDPLWRPGLGSQVSVVVTSDATLRWPGRCVSSCYLPGVLGHDTQLELAEMLAFLWGKAARKK